MTKKFVSLVLSLALVIGLVPMMSVSAEENPTVTELYIEDFTNFDNQSYNADYAVTGNGSFQVTNKENVGRISIGAYCKADIVNMPGYDGNNTNALKLTMNPNLASFSYTAGAGRWTLTGLQTALSGKTTGALVYQLKMYIPEADSDGNRQDINGFVMAPVVKNGSSYGVGTSARDTNKREIIGELNPGEWCDLTYVLLLDEQKVLVYCNDTIVHYKTETVAASKHQFQIHSRRNVPDEHIIFDDFKVWHIAAKSAEDASPKCITSAASFYDDRENVPVAANPTVDFSNMILNRSTVETVSTDNVLMTESDGTTVVPLTSVTVGADKKSIVIDPATDLEKGMKYDVKVTGLKDIFEEAIPDYTFSFTTVEPSSITVSQPVFTKENLFAAGGASQTITALENGYIKASATVSNSANTAKDVMVLSMLKDGEDIKYFQFDNITVPAKGSAAFTGGFQIDNASTQKIETVVWDNITNKTPLADKYAFSSSGYVKTDLDTLLGE